MSICRRCKWKAPSQSRPRVDPGREPSRPLPTAHPGECRRGLSLVELLVCSAIVSVLLGLLLPAVHCSREAARRIACQNHLRQIGVALHGYEAVMGTLPPCETDAPTSVAGACGEGEVEVVDHPGACSDFQSWTGLTLAFMNEASLADHYDLQLPWCSLDNRPAVRTHVSVFTCPSTPGDQRSDPYHVIGAAATDFSAIDEVEVGVFIDVLGIRDPGIRARRGTLAAQDGRSPRHIPDGRSRTIMVAESAGRPLAYFGGRPMTRQHADLLLDGDVASFNNSIIASEGTGWADPDASLDIEGVTARRPELFGPRMINAINTGEVFSFHPNGAQFLFADGSIRWIVEQVDTWAFVTLCTRAGGEVTPPP